MYTILAIYLKCPNLRQFMWFLLAVTAWQQCYLWLFVVLAFHQAPETESSLEHTHRDSLLGQSPVSCQTQLPLLFMVSSHIILFWRWLMTLQSHVVRVVRQSHELLGLVGYQSPTHLRSQSFRLQISKPVILNYESDLIMWADSKYFQVTMLEHSSRKYNQTTYIMKAEK